MFFYFFKIILPGFVYTGLLHEPENKCENFKIALCTNSGTVICEF